jgi:hypothetical protein
MPKRRTVVLAVEVDGDRADANVIRDYVARATGGAGRWKWWVTNVEVVNDGVGREGCE